MRGWPLLLLLLAGCSGAGEAVDRAGWLQEQLLLDNQRWLFRDREQLVEKYDAMEAAPYDWMRGTAALFFADLARPGTDRLPTAFGTDPEATAVLLLGDPHPENLGTVPTGEGLTPTEADPSGLVDGSWRTTLEWVDLDATAWGPWILDLRRAALGLLLLMDLLDGCDEPCRTAAVEALAAGYADEFAAEEPWDSTEGILGEWGEVVAKLTEEALEEGLERKRLDKHTTLQPDGTRTLDVVTELDEEGKGHIALSALEAEQLADLLEAYGRTDAAPAGFRYLGGVRRIGSGISSRPALRFVVLIDRGDDRDVDDELVQVREVVDPPVPAGSQSTVTGLFADNVDRLTRGPDLLWTDAAVGPRVGAMADGAQTFKVLGYSSWNQGLDRTKVLEEWDEDDLSPGDLAELGELMGRSIAAAHGRGPTANGEPGALAIARDLGHRRQVLIDEVRTAAQADHAQLLIDHDLFVQLRADHGALLGADWLD